MIQVVEMCFLCWVAGLSFRKKVRTSVKRTQLTQFEYSHWRPFLLGGDPRADPELICEIIYPLWSGNSLESPRISWSVTE